MPTQVETIDPELQFEPLPEPFRTIDSIVLGIVNSAWSEIRERSTSLNAGRYRQRLPDARPSKITDAATLLSDYESNSTNIACISQTVSYTATAHVTPSDNIGLPPQSSDVGQALVLGDGHGDVVVTAPPGTTFDGMGTTLRLSIFSCTDSPLSSPPEASPLPLLVSTTAIAQQQQGEGQGEVQGQGSSSVQPWQDALVCSGGVVSLPEVIQAPAPYHYQPPLPPESTALPGAAQAQEGVKGKGAERSTSPSRPAAPASQAQGVDNEGEGSADSITARLARVQARPVAAPLPTWSQVERERGLLLAVAGTVVGVRGEGQAVEVPVPATGVVRLLHVPRAALEAGGHWSCAQAGSSENGGYVTPGPVSEGDGPLTMPSLAEVDPDLVHRPADAARLSARIQDALQEHNRRQVRWLASIHLPHGLTAHRLAMSLDSTHLAVVCSDASVRLYHLHPGVVTPPPLPPAAPSAQDIVQLAAARGATLALAGQGGELPPAPPTLLLPIPPAPVELPPLLVLAPPIGQAGGGSPLFTLALPGLQDKVACLDAADDAAPAPPSALPLHVGFHFLASRMHPPPLPVLAGGEDMEGPGGRGAAGKGGARSVLDSRSQGGKGSVAPSRVGGRTSMPAGSGSGRSGTGHSASPSRGGRQGVKVLTGAAALPPPPPPNRHAPNVVGSDGIPVTTGCVVWWTAVGPGVEQAQEGLNAIHRYSLPVPLEQAMKAAPAQAVPQQSTATKVEEAPAPAPPPAPAAAAGKAAPAARPASGKGAPAAAPPVAAPAPPTAPVPKPYPTLPTCSTPVPYPLTTSLLLPGPGPTYNAHEVYSTVAGLPSHAHPVLLLGDTAGHVSAYTFPGSQGGAPTCWATLGRHTASPTLHWALQGGDGAEGTSAAVPPAQAVTALTASRDGLYALSATAGGQVMCIDLHAALGKDSARNAATPTCTHGPGGYEVGSMPGQPYNNGLGLVGGSLLWKAGGNSKGGGDAEQVLSVHTNVHAVRWDGTGPALSARCLAGQPIALVEVLEPPCDRRGTPSPSSLAQPGDCTRSLYAYDMPSGALLAVVRAKSGGSTGILLPSPVPPPSAPAAAAGRCVLSPCLPPGLPLTPALWTTTADSVLLCTLAPGRSKQAGGDRPSLGPDDGPAPPSPRPYGCDVMLWSAYDVIRAGAGPVGLAVRRSAMPAAQTAWNMSGIPHPDALTASLYLNLPLGGRHRALDLHTLLGGGGAGEGMVAQADAMLQKFVAMVAGPGGGGSTLLGGTRARRSSLAGGRRGSMTEGGAPVTQGRRVSISGPETAGVKAVASTPGRAAAGAARHADPRAGVGVGNVFHLMGARDAALPAGREGTASASALLAAMGQRYSNPHSPVDCAGYMSTLLASSPSAVGSLLSQARAGRVEGKGAVTVATLQKEYHA